MNEVFIALYSLGHFENRNSTIKIREQVGKNFIQKCSYWKTKF